MSYSSNGFQATIDAILKKNEDGSIIAEATSYGCKIIKGKKNYEKDCTERIWLRNPNGETLNKGDTIQVNSFYIKNRQGRIRHQFDTFVITDWAITKRNRFVKRYYGQKTDEEIAETKMRQRQEIEEEIEAEEQDLDEYIENNGYDDLPL